MPLDLDSPLPKEVESGNIEYKRQLTPGIKAERFEGLVTQLKWRLEEGSGEALYAIGVEDDGTLCGLSEGEMETSLATLQRMCDRVGAEMLLRHKRPLAHNSACSVAEVLVKANIRPARREVRVACLGGPQAGKSTLVATLSAGGVRDDGQGSARTLVMNHAHELESGETSSVGRQVVGFDARGTLLRSEDVMLGSGRESIAERAERLCTLLDLCGQARYLKTTLYGLSAFAPDFAMVVVRADGGPADEAAARLHVSLAAALKLPAMGVITRADAVGDEQLRRASVGLCSLLQEEGYRQPTLVTTEEELDAIARSSSEEAIALASEEAIAVAPVPAGQPASQEQLRRGIVLVEAESADASPRTAWELEATVRAIRLPTAEGLAAGTEVILHCMGVKQAARVLSVHAAEGGVVSRLQQGRGEATLRLRFVHSAEHVREGSPIILRDSSAGADNLGVCVGVVAAVGAAVRAAGADAVALD